MMKVNSVQADFGARVAWLALAGAILALIAFQGSLLDLVGRWNAQEEYSHGYFIPLIAAWMLWSRRETLAASVGRPSWAGVGVLIFSLILGLVGELSSIFILGQFAFIFALLGVALVCGGWTLLRAALVPIAFLGFAIPLPYFVDSILSLRMQLVSSELAGHLIRLFGITVYLDGNVIDLGVYKLQVADACSGLRYLFPLMSLGFLAAYLFRGSILARATIFLSTIPITIGMNSLRIALIAVLVNAWGVSMAEGMLHLFEGWIIFLACAGLLVGEMYVLARLVERKPLFDVVGVPLTSPRQAAQLPRRDTMALAPAIVCALLLVVTAGVTLGLGHRPEVIPDRSRFASFPSDIGDWRGARSPLDAQVEHALSLDDYVLVDYANTEGKTVNFYVAYYASQRKGTSPHSPLVCMPGGGWQITDFQRSVYSQDGTTFPFNRAIIARGQQKQIVYYWFEQRGRRIANEWLSKWYLLRDALLLNRSDGALIRVTTLQYPGETEQMAEERIRAFIPALSPALRAYLPAPEGERSTRALLEAEPRS